MKTFKERLKELYNEEEGKPPLNSIIKLHDEFISLPKEQSDVVTRQYPAKCSACNGTGSDFSQINMMNTSSVCIICKGKGVIMVTEQYISQHKEQSVRDELIKNLTNQILMGEPQTHLQEKQYKVFRAEEKRLRDELESLKQQAGEVKVFIDIAPSKDKKVCSNCSYWLKWGTHTGTCDGSEEDTDQNDTCDSFIAKQSDTTPDL